MITLFSSFKYSWNAVDGKDIDDKDDDHSDVFLIFFYSSMSYEQPIACQSLVVTQIFLKQLYNL